MKYFYLFLFLNVNLAWSAWQINQIHSSESNGTYKVSCDFAGENVWFESTSSLNDSVEAFASLFLLPALARKAEILIDLPVDREWYENIQKLIPIYCEWWGYPLRNPLIVKSFKAAAIQPEKSYGSCFSCGVDSFYTLLGEGYPIEYLVYIQGFDSPLSDINKISGMVEATNEVCFHLHKKPVFIRTNARIHPLIKSLDWGTHANGPFLASVAHLLSDHIDHFVIPSSNYVGASKKWGSHWRTDSLYSSSTTHILHPAESDKVSRPLKTAFIASYPIVQEKLRVCWQARPEWNCSCCEKCIRTMVDLCACNSLQNFGHTFDLSIPLPIRIDSLHKVDSNAIHFFKESLKQNLPKDVRQALIRLIERSAKKRGIKHFP